jgi:hypothetical protein
MANSPKLLRCRRTDARNATVGSDDEATTLTVLEATCPLKAVLDARRARDMVEAANIRGE